MHKSPIRGAEDDTVDKAGRTLKRCRADTDRELWLLYCTYQGRVQNELWEMTPGIQKGNTDKGYFRMEIF